MEGLGGIASQRNLEVKHFLAHTQFAVQGHRGVVPVVSLHENHVNPSFRSHSLELLNHGRCYTAPPMRLIHCQIVDV